ncbi:hypothetical protein ACLB9X_05750 [Streptomyces sp. 5K101]|uniref:hypothetical protein n=1 Tax=Streptomyces sp. 5K101 TaxID=3390037 RepID=UPI0039763720
MAQHVREIMTQDPVTPAERTPLTEVARLMPERETGDAIIVEADDARGPVTDVSPGNGAGATSARHPRTPPPASCLNSPHAVGTSMATP